MKVSSVSQMRAMDGSAVTTYGIVEPLLMENAGLAACMVLERELGIRGKTFPIFCGGGNNGGDGFVVARKILSLGGTPRVFILSDPGKYRGSAKANLEILSRLPVTVAGLGSVQDAEDALLRCDGVVDAMLGTGIDREVSGVYAAIIEAINRSGRPVLSLDIPSGVNGDTGRVMGCAVAADFTVTFGLPKIGNLLMPGYSLCGRLSVSHISFPPELYDPESIITAVNEPPALPPRDPAGYKGSFGKALFIAGAAGYYGAPYLSAMSFLKAGGGYSCLACPESIVPFIASKGSEIVFFPQKQTADGSLSYENKENLLALSRDADIVVIGPGLSLNQETMQLARELTVAIDKPVIVDADGITALSKDIDLVKRRAPIVLTPHLGEMSRITGMERDRIDADKVGVLTETCRDLGSIIVLKGANSLIGYPDGRVLINVSGNCGMATAGSGDVLTGTIAAMMGLGLDIESAVAKGVFIHGAAGDRAAAESGQDGMVARDVLEHLPRALQMDRNGDLQDLYPGIDVV